MTQAQRILNNRYELLAKIGDGGMAIVYKARDIMLNRTVAVKMLRESYASDPAFLARFKREAQSAANLNHPNIVNVFDVGQEGNLNYIVMEYIEGSNLKELITQEAPLPTQQTVEIAAEICDAIGFAHSKGLIHRDIKPQNILLTPEGKVKVTDFGIAKGFGDQNLTQTGITLGTVHYFSPEQAKGLPVEPQSDIYSIGVVIYEMATGRIPFESDNPVALAVKHIEDPPPPPRRYNPSIPPALEGIILKALSKEPAQRYPSAAAMSKALRNLESQSSMGTMAVQPTTQRRPPSNQYGNNELYSHPAPRQPYPQPNIYAPNPGTNPNPGYVVPPPTYRDPTAEANLRNANRLNPPPVRPGTGYTYESQMYRNGQAGPLPLAEDFEEPPRSTGPGWGAWVIGLLSLAALIALVVVGIVVLPPLLSATPTPLPTAAPATATLAPAVPVNVPDVKGQPETKARQILTDAKLDIGEETQEFDSKITPGSVISQDPAAGQKVNSGTKIKLVVSKGQDLVPVRDYTNTDGKAAADALTKLGFQVQTITQPNDNIQSGAVIKTDPAGGADKQLPRGSIIKVYVSTGRPTPTPQPTATAVPPTPIPPTSAPTPVPPTAIPAPVKVDVPDVFNKPQDEARQILEKAGFKVDVKIWTIDDIKKYYGNDASALAYFNSAQPGTVVGMQPGPTTRPPNLQQDKGSTVTIGVKKG